MKSSSKKNGDNRLISDKNAIVNTMPLDSQHLSIPQLFEQQVNRCPECKLFEYINGYGYNIQLLTVTNWRRYLAKMDRENAIYPLAPLYLVDRSFSIL